VIVKVEVTSLKAAWPPGTQLGAVVDIEGDAVPAWLVGKCRPADVQPAPAETVAAPAPAPAAKSKR
jgi:hypothetical protein